MNIFAGLGLLLAIVFGMLAFVELDTVQRSVITFSGGLASMFEVLPIAFFYLFAPVVGIGLIVGVTGFMMRRQ